jgi:hypothetical protein
LKTQYPWRSWNRWKIKPSEFQNVAYVKQEEAEKIATTALAALKNILYIPHDSCTECGRKLARSACKLLAAKQQPDANQANAVWKLSESGIAWKARGKNAMPFFNVINIFKKYINLLPRPPLSACCCTHPSPGAWRARCSANRNWQTAETEKFHLTTIMGAPDTCK